MRCRVGRKPTDCSISLTSCQGQPVSAGCRPWPPTSASSFEFGMSSLLSTPGTLPFITNVLDRQYRKPAAQMQVFRNWVKEGKFAADRGICAALPVHLPMIESRGYALSYPAK